MHTIDAQGRRDFESRSQTVKWVSLSIVIYCVDRGIRWRRTLDTEVVGGEYPRPYPRWDFGRSLV